MLGHERFALVGHDRGARVGLRLAYDALVKTPPASGTDLTPDLIARVSMRERER